MVGFSSGVELALVTTRLIRLGSYDPKGCKCR